MVIIVLPPEHLRWPAGRPIWMETSLHPACVQLLAIVHMLHGRRAPGILRHRNSPTIPVNLIRFIGIPSISLNQSSRSGTAELTRNMPKLWGPYNPTASLFDRDACTKSFIKTCHLPFKNGNGSLNARARIKLELYSIAATWCCLFRR